MSGSAIDPGIVLRRGKNGGVTRYVPSVDSNAARGLAFALAHADLVADDVLEMGPGDFEIAADVVGVANTTIIGSGPETRWVVTAPESGIRYHPRANQTFQNFASTATGSTFYYHPTTDPNTVDNVTFIDLFLTCGEDSLYIDGPVNGTVVRTWRAYNCRFKSSSGTPNNDTIVIYGNYFTMKFFGCEWENYAPGNPALNSSCLEVGDGDTTSNTLAECYGCTFLTQPSAQPDIDASGITTGGDSICRLFNCNVRTVTGGFTSVRSLRANDTSTIEVYGGYYDPSLASVEAGGAKIVSYEARTYETAAAAGNAQANATDVNASFVLATAADATKGIQLRAIPIGDSITVKNNAAAVLKVYGQTGVAINGLAANAAIEMAANTIATFFASSATQLWTLPLLPS